MRLRTLVREASKEAKAIILPKNTLGFFLSFSFFLIFFFPEHLRNVENTWQLLMFSKFPLSSQTPVVFRDSVINSFGYFICKVQGSFK